MTVWFFQSNIDVYKQDWQAQAMKSHNTQLQDLYAVSKEESQTKSAQALLEQAITQRNEAKPTPAMLLLQDKVTKQQQLVVDAEKEVFAKDLLRTKAKEKLRIATLEKDVATATIQRLEQEVVQTTKSLTAANTELRRLRDELLSVQTQYAQKVDEHNQNLDTQVQWRTQQSQLATQHYNTTQTQLDKANEQYAQTTQNATKAKFFNDAAILLKLMVSDIWIGSVCVFLMLIALLVDIMPLIAKQQLQKMPHAQKIYHAADQELSVVRLDTLRYKLSVSQEQWNLEKAQWEIEKQRALLKEQRDAQRPWYLRWILE